MSNALKKLISYIALIAILALPFIAYSNINALTDWWKLRGYVAPVEIEQLTLNDSMTTKAKHLFYINHPQLISSKTEFRKACPQNEQTIVLGCYHSMQNGIALFDVTDKRLRGAEEVTAAHEMLHAVYDRLSSSKKEQVNRLLKDYYSNKLTDKRIIKVMEAYKVTEPNDVVNEMHSVFGTEVEILPNELENYYSQYFINRQKVVDYSKNYQSVFDANTLKLKNLKDQINDLKSELNSLKSQIESLQAILEDENQRMQQLLKNGNNKAYNNTVYSYNSKVEELSILVNQYNSNVESINKYVKQYNNLAYTQEGLYDSLDTRVKTQTVR
jgi:hypothetical protein